MNIPQPPTQPRLARIDPESKQYGKTTYRKALKKLLEESGCRCAYSLEHIRDFGTKTMEVDHFNPTLKHPARNMHGNLLAASRHCNGSKWDHWPTDEQQDHGVRFLNPYLESDYGVHIFENLDSGELFGATPAGRWHIDMLDLNAEHLVMKRLDRTKLLHELQRSAYCSGADQTNKIYDALSEFLPTVKDTIYSKMIPPIEKTKKSKHHQQPSALRGS